jgi:membrane-bound serine protease (ClpP class)
MGQFVSKLGRRQIIAVVGIALAMVLGLRFSAVAAEPAGAAAAAKAEAAKRRGYCIHIRLPITPQTPDRVRQAVGKVLDKAERDGILPVLIFQFDVPRGGDDAESVSRGSEFEDCSKLAKFLVSSRLNRATTVAYIPKPIKGHAVLVALACGQIIMAPDASIGSAGIDIPERETVSPDMLSTYESITRQRRMVPVEVVLGMLDRQREVIKVKTEVSTEYITPDKLVELRKDHTIGPQETWKRSGELLQLSGSDGRKLGFVSFLAADGRDVARALELPPEAVEDDPSLDRAWRAMRVDLKGPINADRVNAIQRLIQDEIAKRDVNFVCVVIDSPGGAPEVSMKLAKFLTFDLDPSKVRTVAYIPAQARADAALVAMACDQVVMHPRAVLGGPGAYEMSEEEVRDRQDSLKTLAPRKLRSWSLWAAMLNRRLEVFRCTRMGGEAEYFCDDELKEQDAAKEQPQLGRWTKGQPVTTLGTAFQADGNEAVGYHLANYVVESFDQFKQQYSLEEDPDLIEPGWADFLIDALKSQGVAVLLLVIGFAALYIELHAPGIGIGGFVAAVCFLLFFWSRYLGGTADWLEVLLFLAGIACLLLEVFVVPGTAIFGLGGGALVLASLVLATQTSRQWPRNEYQMAQMQRSLLTVAAALAGLVGTAIFLRRWLPRAPILNRIFLPPPEGEEAEDIRRREMSLNLESLVAAHGVTATPLTPGGKARFGNTLVDAVTRGEFIPRGAAVVVVEIRGNRVLVQAEESV